MSRPAPVLQQRWEDLLFCNWPVEAATLRPLVPEPLEIDVAEGTAWLSVVPMWMGDVGVPGSPPEPTLSGFPEVNVRTYVRAGDHEGVWFFSLDTPHATTVRAGRELFHLPYFLADASMERGDSFTFRSSRAGEAGLDVDYRVTGPPAPPAAGSLEHFLVERYSMFCATPGGRVHRGDIEHEPWLLQPADARLRTTDLVAGLGVAAATRAVSFYAASIDVRFRPLVALSRSPEK